MGSVVMKKYKWGLFIIIGIIIIGTIIFLLYPRVKLKNKEVELGKKRKESDLDFPPLYDKLYIRPFSEIKFEAFLINNLNLLYNLTVNVFLNFAIVISLLSIVCNLDSEYPSNSVSLTDKSLELKTYSPGILYGLTSYSVFVGSSI